MEGIDACVGLSVDGAGLITLPERSYHVAEHSATQTTDPPMKIPTTLPNLTPGGRLCYFIGFLAVGLWVRLETRPLLVLGACLLLGVMVSYIMALGRLKRLTLRVRRAGIVRAFEPGRVAIELESGRSLAGLSLTNPVRPNLGIRAYVDAIVAGTPSRISATETHTRRGWVEPGDIEVACSRPLGLAVTRRRFPSPGGQLVLPAVGRLWGPLRRLASSGGQRQQQTVRRRGAGVETLFVRRWEPGDPARHIHWRASARRGEVMTRELEDEDGGVFVLGLAGVAGRTARRRMLTETAVSLATTILRAVSLRGRDVLLLVQDEDPALVPGGDRGALFEAECSLARAVFTGAGPDWRAISGSADVCAAAFVHPGEGLLPSPPDWVRPVSTAEALERRWFAPGGGALS